MAQNPIHSGDGNTQSIAKQSTTIKPKINLFKMLKKLFGFTRESLEEEEEEDLSEDYVEDEKGEENSTKVKEVVKIMCVTREKGEDVSHRHMTIFQAVWDLSANEGNISIERKQEALDIIFPKNSLLTNAIDAVGSVGSALFGKRDIEGFRKFLQRDENIATTKDDADKNTSTNIDRKWYGDEDIQAGLNNSLSNTDNTEIGGSVQVEHADLLKDSVEKANTQATEGKTILMSFNVDNNHWVGGLMTKIGNDVCFIHNDPMGKAINLALKKELKDQKIEIVDLQQTQQVEGDTYNCGPFIVDNLEKFNKAAQDANEKGLNLEEFKASIRLEQGLDAGQRLRGEQSSRVDRANEPQDKSSELPSQESKGDDIKGSWTARIRAEQDAQKSQTDSRQQ